MKVFISHWRKVTTNVNMHQPTCLAAQATHFASVLLTMYCSILWTLTWRYLQLPSIQENLGITCNSHLMQVHMQSIATQVSMLSNYKWLHSLWCLHYKHWTQLSGQSEEQTRAVDYKHLEPETRIDWAHRLQCYCYNKKKYHIVMNVYKIDIQIIKYTGNKCTYCTIKELNRNPKSTETYSLPLSQWLEAS